MSYDYELHCYDDMDCGEESYGLCDQCANNNSFGSCSEYKMPLRMCQRKKKCKHFHQQGNCMVCNTPFEYFTDWNDYDVWEYVVCLKCGKPYKFGSKEHLSHIIVKIISWRYPLPQNHALHSMITRRSKEYIKTLREYQELYFSALFKKEGF